MTVEGILRQLKALGNAGVRAQNAKWGAGDNQFGVNRGDVRKLAAKIKTNHDLAWSLWNRRPRFARRQVLGFKSEAVHHRNITVSHKRLALTVASNGSRSHIRHSYPWPESDGE